MFDFINRLSDTSIFQGSLNKRNYFEGWYFKQIGSYSRAKLAFIPGISLSRDDDHAFIQVYDGSSGISHYLTYDLKDFVPQKDPFSLKIGRSYFKLSGIELDIPELGIEGSLSYSDHSYYKSRWFERDVMGWYGYIPFMETYHGLISLDHLVEGNVKINREDHIFNIGRGYIEKDWGQSFPSSWIWMQSNTFSKEKTSLMVSVAVIPWFNSSFIGHLAVMLLEDEILNLSKYRGGKINSLRKNKDGVELRIETKRYSLEIQANKGESVSLLSPLKGEMKGRTIETLSGRLEVTLTSKPNDELLFFGTTENAGLEIMDGKHDLNRKLGI